MVIAKFEMDASRYAVSLHVKGHAGQNKVGLDIICASATILAYTIAQTIKMERAAGRLKYSPTIKLRKGDAIISCRCKDEQSYRDILRSYLTVQSGYIVLAHNYPQYVAVEPFGDSEQSSEA